jgi:hypothetical protein
MFGVKPDQASINKAEQSMDGFVSFAKKAAGAIGGFFAVRWLKDATEQVAALGDQWDKMSLRTGTATDTLQRFSHAAELSGASISEIEGSIKKLQNAQVEAADGVATYSDEFKRLGLDVKDADGKFKNAEDLLIEVADGMTRLESDTERTAVAMKLMGRGGTALIPLLKQGGDAVRAMMSEVDELGALMGTDLIKASADYTDNMQRLSMVFMALKISIAKNLLPILIKLQDRFISWWKDNREQIKKFVDRIWGALKSISSLISTLISVGKAIWKVFSALPNVVKILALVAAFMSWGKGMYFLGTAVRVLLSPLGKFFILVALLGLIFEDLKVWVEGGNSVFGRFFETLDELTGINISGPMKDIIKWFMALAQDPVAAIEQLKQEWIVVLETIQENIKLIWNDIVQWLTEKLNALGATFRDIWENGILGLLKTLFGETFVELVGKGLDALFDLITSWGSRAVDAIFAPIRKAAGWLGKFVAGEPAISVSQKAQGLFPRSEAGAQLPALPTSGRGGATVTQNTDIKIDVKAAPGMNEGTLAAEVGRQMQNQLDRQNRAAMRTLVPGTVGG